MRPFALLALLLAGATPASAQITPETLSADVKTLASDAFGGRAPGTPGKKTTVDWLVGQFTSAGLQPGGPNRSWTQAVPLIRTRLGQGTVSANGTCWSIGRDVYLSTVRPIARTSIAHAPMVFVGYGVTAAEWQWTM